MTATVTPLPSRAEVAPPLVVPEGLDRADLVLLRAMADRRVLSVTDVITHRCVAWIDAAGGTEEAARVVAEAVHELIDAGYAQLSPWRERVRWHDGTAHGRRVLPTVAAIRALEIASGGAR